MLSQASAFAGAASSVAPSTALLTEAHGNVFKRDFTDWTRETMSDPIPAAVGDTLHEGMQVGTGDKSWAQLKWRNMCARAWANSVYAIAPNQRLVYLVGGEMLYQLDKNRKDKSNYFVWTNLLQARIRGTTVLFQATKEKSRITVLEGTVEVFNKVDRSVVTLTPGVVYEVAMKKGAETPAGTAPAAAAQELTNISSSKSQSVPVFDTAKTISSVTAVDPAAVLSHPLLTSFDTPLASLPLVNTAMTTVQGLLDTTTGTLKDVVNGLLKDNFGILTAPRALSYNLGNDVGNIATLKPGVFEFFGPTGVLRADGTIQPLNVPVVGSVPGVGAVTPTLNNVVPNLPNVGGAIGSVTSGLGAATGATAGMTSALGGATAGIGSTVGTTIQSTTGSLGGVVGGTVSGVTGAVGGTTSAVGGTVGGVVNGVGGVLNGVTGGLTGGLFGH
jgi:hypothetical protein